LDWIEVEQAGWRIKGCLSCHPILCRMRFDHPDDHPNDPSLSVWTVWTDEASNVSRLDPSGAIQVDAEHPSRNRKVLGPNPTSGATPPRPPRQ
jgi:hypothetical protein